MFDKNFYPTPEKLIDKMLDKVNLSYYRNILEPSAGKGDIVDLIKDKTKYTRGCNPSMDVIELNPELQLNLKGKNYNLIHDDFLTFNTFKRYDLIIMNPPFDNGDKHLLKALEIQRRGGEIVCILNADTLRNPYSNTRNQLMRLLEKYEADVTYLENEFTQAERKTNVDIALVHVNIKKDYADNLILDTLKNQTKLREIEQQRDIVSNDPLEQAIQRYNFEIEAGLNLIYNYFSIAPMIQDNLKEDTYTNNILEIKVKGDASTGIGIINDYVEEVRHKYWKALIDMDMFEQILTTDLIYEFHDHLDKLRKYDFTKFNINQVVDELQSNLTLSVEETIYELFKDFTRKYSYDEYSSNIHLFDGWKTNICYKINDKRVIYPRLSAYNSIISPVTFTPTYGGLEGKIRDIEMALNYLDGGSTEGSDNIRDILKAAEDSNQSKKVEFKYFFIDFYRKGTGHIIWKDKELIKKLNIFGSKKEGGLPPSYGNTKYDDMSKEEQEVIDSFEGEKEYRKTMSNPKYYLYESKNLLQLQFNNK